MSDEWKLRAACRGMGPALFFQERGEPTREAKAAKAVCAGCKVSAACLAEGMVHRFGIWGGTSERERRRMRKVGKAA